MIHVFAFLAVLLISSNTIVSRMASGVIAPDVISFYRWAFAVIILTPFCLPKVLKQWHIIKSNLWKFFIPSFLGLTLGQLLGYYAARTTTATNIGLIFSLGPILSIFLSALILKQRIKKIALFGATLSLCGLAYLLGHGDVNFVIEQGFHEGDLLVFIGTVSYSLYVVLLKLWRVDIDSWSSLYIQGIFALICLMVLVSFVQPTFPIISSESAGLVVYAAIMGSIGASWLWMRAVDGIGVSASTIYLNLIPIFTLIFATLILNESIHIFHIIGGVLVIAGVTIAQYKPRAQLSS